MDNVYHVSSFFFFSFCFSHCTSDVDRSFYLTCILAPRDTYCLNIFRVEPNRKILGSNLSSWE